MAQPNTEWSQHRTVRGSQTRKIKNSVYKGKMCRPLKLNGHHFSNAVIWDFGSNKPSLVVHSPHPKTNTTQARPYLDLIVTTYHLTNKGRVLKMDNIGLTHQTKHLQPSGNSNLH